MNPWAIAAAIVGAAGIVLFATAARAGEECEIATEAVTPYMGFSAILLRECHTADRTYWLWDVALTEDVEIGEAGRPEVWPEESLGRGQTDDQDQAIVAAMEWVDDNLDFVLGGGERGPLAQRTEDFLGELTPGQFAELRETFRFAEPIGDAWLDVEQLRTTASDSEYIEIARGLGGRLDNLTADERADFEDDILEAIGIINGITLRGILSDAGVM